MKKIIFVVHPEYSYNQDPEYKERLNNALKEYDFIIVLRTYESESLINVPVNRQWYWIYGYSPGCLFSDKEDRYIIPSGENRWTYVTPEIRKSNLENFEVFIGGGIRDKCLSDWTFVLDYLEIEYKIVEELTYEQSDSGWGQDISDTELLTSLADQEDFIRSNYGREPEDDWWRRQQHLQV